MTKSELEAAIERVRPEITGYCYRMLGSPFDAEDAVQETLLRAWESIDRLEHDAAFRTWLYRIATNVCLDLRKSSQRRARPMDLAAPSGPGTPLGAPLPETVWVGPIPDHLVLPTYENPAELAVARESVRLAIVAALQHLPPRQRAVLLLRDVLRWKAAEVAALFNTSVASVNSSLQRARSTLAAVDWEVTEVYRPDDDVHRALVARYVEAFERNDVDALVALLHQDASMSMPPFTWWVRGYDVIRQCMVESDACRGSRLIPTVANGSPAFGQYRKTSPSGPYEPFALVLLELVGDRISSITNFLYGDRLFPLFDLPTRLTDEGIASTHF